MDDTSPAGRAMAAAVTSLIVAVGGIGAFLPPFTERVAAQPALVVGVGLLIASALVLHLMFVALLARRLGRAPAKWVVAALLLFPIGSIVGLVYLHWSHHVDQAPAGRTA